MSILGALIAPAAEAFKARAARKQAQEQAVHETDIAKEEAWREYAKQNIDADVVWETEAQKQSGWKDELWSLVFAGVFVGSFVPVVQDYVMVGIMQLDAYPHWFQVVFVSVILAAFGIRFWRRNPTS